MKITLNGDPYELAGPATIADLLNRLEVDARRVAVERNLTVVRRALFETTEIHDGDQIEIVNFVGGGAPAATARLDERHRAGETESFVDVLF